MVLQCHQLGSSAFAITCMQFILIFLAWSFSTEVRLFLLRLFLWTSDCWRLIVLLVMEMTKVLCDLDLYLVWHWAYVFPTLPSATCSLCLSYLVPDSSLSGLCLYKSIPEHSDFVLVFLLNELTLLPSLVCFLLSGGSLYIDVCLLSPFLDFLHVLTNC